MVPYDRFLMSEPNALMAWWNPPWDLTWQNPHYGLARPTLKWSSETLLVVLFSGTNVRIVRQNLPCDWPSETRVVVLFSGTNARMV